MTLRECVVKICKDNGMADEEIEQFLEFADENNISGGKQNSIRRKLEELSSESQKRFWNKMIEVIPLQVDAWRKIKGTESDNQSLCE